MQQGEYRGALEAAQQRIEVLQRDLDAAQRLNPPPPPPPGTPLLVGILAVVGGLVMLFVGLGVGIAALQPRSSDYEPVLQPVGPVRELAPPKLVLGAAWYAAAGIAPTAPADLNGDGKTDVIAAFWRDSEPDEPLWIAAVDRVKLEPIWVAGPFASQRDSVRTHLLTTGEYVVVTDSRELVHVLDLQTGSPVHDVSLPGGAARACAVAENAALVRVDRAKEARVLDLLAGTLRAPRAGERVGCAAASKPPRRPATVLAGDTLEGAAKVRTLPTERSVLGLYPLATGLRLVARSLDSEDVLWKTTVFGTPSDGAESIFVLGDEVFVLTREGVHAIALESGNERRFGGRI